jgi:hypothetical protein
MPAADISASQASGPLPLGKQCGESGLGKTGIAGIHIIDIRRKAVEISLKDDILAQFRPKAGPRTLPTLLLYNERGLQLFEDVIFTDGSFLHCVDANKIIDHVSRRVLSDQ